MSGTEIRSTQRISGSEHSELGRWLELLFMLLKELWLNVLFMVPPLTLLLFWAERQPSSCFNSAHVASLSLSDSGVSRDTLRSEWIEAKEEKEWRIDCLVDCETCWLYRRWFKTERDELIARGSRLNSPFLVSPQRSFLNRSKYRKSSARLTLLLQERRRGAIVLDCKDDNVAGVPEDVYGVVVWTSGDKFAVDFNYGVTDKQLSCAVGGVVFVDTRYQDREFVFSAALQWFVSQLKDLLYSHLPWCWGQVRLPSVSLSAPSAPSTRAAVDWAGCWALRLSAKSPTEPARVAAA